MRRNQQIESEIKKANSYDRTEDALSKSRLMEIWLVCVDVLRMSAHGMSNPYTKIGQFRVLSLRFGVLCITCLKICGANSGRSALESKHLVTTCAMCQNSQHYKTLSRSKLKGDKLG